MTSDPYTISNLHRKSKLVALVSKFGMDGVTCSVDAHIGTNEGVITNAYFCTIQNHQVKIRIEILPQVDIIAIIAIKWRSLTICSCCVISAGDK